MHSLRREVATAICERCDGSTHVTEETIYRYLSNRGSCRTCGGASSLYKALVATLTGQFAPLFLTSPAAVIGAVTLSIPFVFERHKAVELDLTKYGVPVGSHILRVSYLPYGPLMPLEWHGNQPTWEPLLVRALYGVDLLWDGASPVDTCDLSVSVTFVPPRPGQTADYMLSQAYTHFLARQWGQMAIAAITGVEYTLKSAFGKIDGLKDKQYLTKHYEKYCQENQIPPPEKGIIHKVARLWGTRDKYAHEGAMFETYNEKSAVTQICAVLLLYRHIKLYGPAH